MARIPEETINQVIAATDIVSLIGRSVKLRKEGAVYKGLCPFHNEKTPSFQVSPARGNYHCFGCQAGGTVIRFVMEHDGLSFVEAVKRLADAANIRIEEEVWDANAEAEAKHRTLLLRANREAAAWFHQLLMKHQLAAPAREYLKTRGISAEMAKSWQMGYAPQNKAFFREWAAQQKLSESALIDAGIFAVSGQDDEGRGGWSYPRWQHRLMFPIRNDNTDVIAFSGRMLDPDGKGGKYVNTAETALFTKSKVLFGFDKSKRHISKSGQAIVCEGQIDMIMVYEAGFQNVVASQGTAFTELHARMLKKVCNEVILCFDSDNAGYAAVEKTFRVLSPEGISVRVASLPAGEDPDSLLRKHGKEAMQELLNNAADFLEYQIRRMRASAKSDGMAERVRMAEEVASAISIFSGVAQRVTAVNKVAKLLEISEEQLNAMVKRAANDTKANTQQPNASKTDARPDESAKKLLEAQNKHVVLLCQLALSDAQVLHWLRQTDCDDILREVPGTDLLALLWHSSYDPLNDVSQTVYMAGLERHQEAAFTQIMAQARPPGGLEEAQQTLAALAVMRLQSLVQRAQAKLRQPGLSAQQLEELQHAFFALQAELKESLDRNKGELDTQRPASQQ